MKFSLKLFTMVFLIFIGLGIIGVVGWLFVTSRDIDKDKKRRLENITRNGYSDEIHFSLGEMTIAVDEEKKKIIWIHNNGSSKVIKFEDITEFEILKNGHSVSKMSKSGVIVGGLLAGGIGALIGSGASRKSTDVTTRLDLVLYFENMKEPVIKINFYNNSEGSYSEYHLNVMQQFEGIMKVIMKRNQEALIHS